jgi:hypothetical protein
MVAFRTLKFNLKAVIKSLHILNSHDALPLTTEHLGLPGILPFSQGGCCSLARYHGLSLCCTAGSFQSQPRSVMETFQPYHHLQTVTSLCTVFP